MGEKPGGLSTNRVAQTFWRNVSLGGTAPVAAGFSLPLLLAGAIPQVHPVAGSSRVVANPGVLRAGLARAFRNRSGNYLLV
jgi:hypothetical protein